MLAELSGEPVAGPVRRRAADGFPQRGVLGDQPGGTGPRRKCIDGLDYGRADHDADRVSGAAGPACLFQIRDKPDDLGQAQQGGDLSRVTRGWYFGGGHGVQSLGPAPGVLTHSRGHLYLITGPLYIRGLTKCRLFRTYAESFSERAGSYISSVAASSGERRGRCFSTCSVAFSP